MTMTLFAIGFLLPAFSVLLCVHSNYRFRNLVGMNELFGSFLIVPFLFSVQFLSLFEMEEQNHTLKNILVIGISKENLFVKAVGFADNCFIVYSSQHDLYNDRRASP